MNGCCFGLFITYYVFLERSYRNRSDAVLGVDLHVFL